MIGDKDLLDVYDAGDPIPVRLRLLARVHTANVDTVHRLEVVRLLRAIADEVANGG